MISQQNRADVPREERKSYGEARVRNVISPWTATSTICVCAKPHARPPLGVDIFNAMNSNVPLGYLQTYGSTWLRPTSVLDARFARVSGQIDF